MLDCSCSERFISISSVRDGVPETRADEEEIPILYESWKFVPEGPVRQHIPPLGLVHHAVIQHT